MKKINFFVIAALFISSLLIVSCDESSEEEVEDITVPEKFHSVDGKFKVYFSGTPDVTNDTIPTEVGTIEMYMFMYEKSITEAEMIAYSDYPSEMVALSNADDMLQGAKEGAVNNLEAVITDEKEIMYNKHKGLEFKANSTQFYVNYKIFLVNNRLYQIAIMRDGSYASQENVDKFFNSFELIEDTE